MKSVPISILIGVKKYLSSYDIKEDQNQLSLSIFSSVLIKIVFIPKYMDQRRSYQQQTLRTELERPHGFGNVIVSDNLPNIELVLIMTPHLYM